MMNNPPPSHNLLRARAASRSSTVGPEGLELPALDRRPCVVRSISGRNGDYAGSGAASPSSSSWLTRWRTYARREARARGTVAAVLERARVAREAGVAEIEATVGGQRRSRPRGTGRQHAVEHVDAAGDHLEDPLRVADPHEVAGLAGRQQRRRPADRVEHLLPVLPDRQPAERVAVEVERRDLLDRAPAQLRIGAALGDAEDELARSPAPPRAGVSPTASSAGPPPRAQAGRHRRGRRRRDTSRCPSRGSLWMSATSSGVNRSADPS